MGVNFINEYQQKITKKQMIFWFICSMLNLNNLAFNTLNGQTGIVAKNFNVYADFPCES